MVVRGRWCRFLLIELVCILFGLFVAEFGIFSGFRCDHVAVERLRPKLDGSLHRNAKVLVVSDVHILGERKRTWIDRWWTDRQVKKSTDAASMWLRPSTLVSLGDHLDEGYTHTDVSTWNRYVERFKMNLRTWKEDTRAVYGVVGNHDAQNGHLMTPAMIHRFQDSFGAVNQVVKLEETGLELVIINAMALDRCFGFGTRRRMNPDDWLCENVLKFLEQIAQNDKNDSMLRILMLHMPLFREDDLKCGEKRSQQGGHVTYVSAATKLKVGTDVLSSYTSDVLLSKVKPDYVLSGHTHAECVYFHKSQDFVVPEITLRTYSWRMRPDPGFAVLEQVDSLFRIRLCQLPNEYITITLYVLSAIGSSLLGIYIFMRIHDVHLFAQRDLKVG